MPLRRTCAARGSAWPRLSRRRGSSRCDCGGDLILQRRETRQSTYDYRWVVLAVAALAQATASFVTQGLGILAGFLQQDFQLSNLEVGLLIAAANVAPIVALPVVGDLL